MKTKLVADLVVPRIMSNIIIIFLKVAKSDDHVTITLNVGPVPKH